MAFCKKCGAELDENAKQCPACGAPVEEEKSSAEKVFADLNNTADTTGEYDPKDIENNKVMGILAYIGILFLVPLLAAPKSKFARFHTNQGLVLFLAEIILGVAAGILSLIPIVGWIVRGVVGVVGLVLMILGIVNAANGKAKELPVIGKFKLLK